jgi:hypothetical protein
MASGDGGQGGCGFARMERWRGAWYGGRLKRWRVALQWSGEGVMAKSTTRRGRRVRALAKAATGIMGWMRSPVVGFRVGARAWCVVARGRARR